MPLYIAPPPLLITSTDAITAGGAAQTMVINNVYLYAFELAVSVTFTGAKWRCSGTAVGSTDIGIYTFAGTLLGNIGGTNNVTSTSMSANFATAITCAPGQYFMALTNSTAEHLFGITGFANTAVLSRCRLAVNTSTGTGVSLALPSTTGGYTDSPGVFPAFALTVSGGLT